MSNERAKNSNTEKPTGRQTAKHAAKKSKKPMRALLAVVAFIIVVLTVFAFYVNGYSKVYPNTYIEDINMGGKTQSEVMDILVSKYPPNEVKGKSLTLKCGDNTYTLSTDELGVVFDHVALSEKAIASGREGNILSKLLGFVSHIAHKDTITPVIIYDDDVLEKAFNSVTYGCEIEPVGHTFTIEPSLVVIHGPVNGLKVDRDSAISLIENKLWTGDFSDIILTPTAVVPQSLDFDEFYKWLTSDAQDAYYEKVDGKVTIKPSKYKCSVDKQTVSDALDRLAASADNTVKISVVTTAPEKTTEHLTETLYKDVLGKYTTSFASSSASRANNVRLAASRINGIELMPGEEFSYDKTILPRTAANGYMAAGVYVGNKSEIGMGGGICQPSSTLYAAALYANMKIVERHNHSLPVSYLPLGLDATIAEGVLDFRFSNSSEYPIKISASANGGVLTFSILGYNPNGISVDIERSFSGGIYYVTRVVKENGIEINREKMASSKYGTPEKEEEKKPEPEKQPEKEETQQPPAVSDSVPTTTDSLPVTSNEAPSAESSGAASQTDVPETPSETMPDISE